jgi:hypothetical protein
MDGYNKYVPKDNYIFIFLIFLVAIILILSTPLFLSYYGYGTWEKIETACKARTNKCADGGVKRTEYRCIPNSSTGYGCLDNGRMTYDTYIQEEDCIVSCFESQWGEPMVSQCIDELKEITITCVSKDNDGPNGCTRLIEGINQVNPIGYSYTLLFPCPPIRDIGKWVLLNEESIHLPRDKWIDTLQGVELITGSNEGVWNITSACQAEGILQEGINIYTLACTDGNRYYIPSDQEGPGPHPCPLVKPDPIFPCRLLPNTYSYLIPWISSEPKLGISIPNLPGSIDGSFPFFNKMTTNQLNSDLGIDVIASSFGTIEGCTSEEILKETSMRLIIIPMEKVEYIRYGTYNARIAALPSRGFHGILAMVDGKLIWYSAKIQNGGIGKILAESSIFRITLENINSGHGRLTLKDQNGDTIFINKLGTEGIEEIVDLNNIFIDIYPVDREQLVSSCDYHKRIFVQELPS